MAEADHARSSDRIVRAGRVLCLAGAVAAFLLLAYSLATMIQMVLLGGPPKTAAEAFHLLEGGRLVGLLRLDLPTFFAMPLYGFLFLGLAAALWTANRTGAVLSTALVFVGVSLMLAAPSALSMLALSEQHAAATTEAARRELLAAGEAAMAADIWHGGGAVAGGILVQVAGVLISAVMLRSTVFGRFTAWLGILMHGVDLAHIVLGLLIPVAGFVCMAIAGPFYPVWFFLIGRTLLRTGRREGAHP